MQPTNNSGDAKYITILNSRYVFLEHLGVLGPSYKKTSNLKTKAPDVILESIMYNMTEMYSLLQQKFISVL